MCDINVWESTKWLPLNVQLNIQPNVQLNVERRCMMTEMWKAKERGRCNSLFPLIQDSSDRKCINVTLMSITLYTQPKQEEMVEDRSSRMQLNHCLRKGLHQNNNVRQFSFSFRLMFCCVSFTSLSKWKSDLVANEPALYELEQFQMNRLSRWLKEKKME
jgi:hypothetical protein